MARLGRKNLARLFLWLLVFVPIKPFYSERPYIASRLPLTKGDLASNHLQSGIYLALSCGEDHINATLARADVTRWLNPTVMLTSLAEIFVVAMTMMVVMYVLVMAPFWCCHLGVYWAVSGRYTPPKINNNMQRGIVQVLVSGHVQTEFVTVHLDSPGKTLYRAVQERRETLVTLVHGVNIIRQGVSLREHGIHHLSTVFILPVMGGGGGRTRLDQEPTMPQLTALLIQGTTRHIDIVEGIGVKWAKVGTILLDDKDGTIIPAIAQQHGNNAELINLEILRRWLQGKGIRDRTWRGLLGVLRVHCGTLASRVKEALRAEEAEQDKPTTPVHHPVSKIPRPVIAKLPVTKKYPHMCPPGTKKTTKSSTPSRQAISKPPRPVVAKIPVHRKSPLMCPPSHMKTKKPSTPLYHPVSKIPHTPFAKKLPATRELPKLYSSGSKKQEPSCPSVQTILKCSPTSTATHHAKDQSPTPTARQELSPLPAAHLPQISSPPSPDQPHTSPPSPTHCPALQPCSPEWHFNQYLVKFYSCSKDPVATWPPSPSEKFINLAAINREKVSSAELHKFMLETLNKGVDTILETKAPVHIEQLMDTKPGIKQKCVLVEGAPGVGKTTLSWEICKRWAEGNLFKQYSLVLLLRLRDETVQNAMDIKDLVLYPYEEQVEGITKYLKFTNDTNTLILLEGLDELPQHLLTRPSIFTRLLAGTDLPDVTILVTSRPSATAQLWKNWKQRITKHVEILGFTEDNITSYVASILDQQELPSFNTYLCTAPSIRQLMYIPLHSGIIVELYRMRKHSVKLLPTNKTALYKALVNIILTRYLANHPTYKDDDLEVDEFTDLPDDIYAIFTDITKLAYESVSQQQLIFKDKDKPVQHLGLMDVVAELFPNRRNMIYSFNFLHLSIQEYLGAVYMSLMDTSSQEELLESMCMKKHLQNMAMFLAGITKFKDMNPDLVKKAIQGECKKMKGGTLVLSRYCLELAFEVENISLLHGYGRYGYNLSEHCPLFDFTALGYFMARSMDKWALQFDCMESTSGIDLLLQALQDHRNCNYTIDSIECAYEDPKIAQQLLIGIPSHTLPLVEKLQLGSGGNLQPLPICLPEVISKMNKLCVLHLYNATSATLADTLRVLTTAPIHSLDLKYSQLKSPAMEALCTFLKHNYERLELFRRPQLLEKLGLRYCGITDDLACILAKGLQHAADIGLRHVNLEGNTRIGDKGRAVLDKCRGKYETVSIIFY